MKSMKLDPAMGAGVLARLREFTDLPAAGYVAGQSVASALSELYGDGKAVKYNDVDVFKETVVPPRNEHGERVVDPAKAVFKRRERVLKTCLFTNACIDESYGHISLSSVKRYKVTRTSRSGMLNEVHCLFETKDPQQFLQTFDMNCVQTCVDLETGKLHWTSQYEVFHTTRQLDIVTLHTPFHSLIRYFKKRMELEGTFGNDERIIEMLAAAYRIATIGKTNLVKPVECDDLRWSFGQLYLKKFEEVSSKILPHFEVATEMHKGYPISTLIPRFEPGADLVMSNVPSVMHGLPAMSRALREKHGKGLQERLNYLCRDAAVDSWVRTKWFVAGDAFLKSNVTVAEIAAMDKLFLEHRIARVLDSDTLGDTWETFKAVRDEARSRGEWVYGMLENTPLPNLSGPSWH